MKTHLIELKEIEIQNNLGVFNIVAYPSKGLFLAKDENGEYYIAVVENQMVNVIAVGQEIPHRFIYKTIEQREEVGLPIVNEKTTTFSEDLLLKTIAVSQNPNLILGLYGDKRTEPYEGNSTN